MNIKLSPREKILVFTAILAVIFMGYWYIFLNPILLSINRSRSDIAALENQLKRLEAGVSLTALMQREKRKLDILPQEKQIKNFLSHIDTQFKRYRIKLVSLKQFSDNNIITIDLRCESTYYELLGFLNTLHELSTLLVIDNVKIRQEGSRVITEMRILSGHL